MASEPRGGASRTPQTLTPDICVIGAGSGGLSVAAAAAAFGVPVVLIEKGKMGGDCLNYGCVPSKALLAAAKRAQAMRAGAAFGVAAQRPTVDFVKVHGHVHGVIAAIAPNDSKERFTGLGVQVIEGAARFKSKDTVAVGDGIEIKARRFVVATGAAPAAPPIPGLDQAAYLTNETVFDLTVCPEHLVIIGAGPVGLEMAQAFRRLGAAVTVIEAAHPLAGDDPECTAVLLDQLAREGVVIRAGANVLRVEPGTKPRVIVATATGEETIEASHLLVATGRRPNLDGLDLAAAGIRTNPRGIRVNKRLRTSNRRVYAVGDVAGGPQFTHAANYHAGIVIRNTLFRLRARVNANVIPRVTYTDPELASVGVTDAQAAGRRIRVLRWPYHENDRAQTERETRGHIKVITTERGRILGATIVGAHAGELIVPWVLAVTQGLNIRAFAEVVMPYPTLAEIGKRAAVTYFSESLTNPFVQRIIRALRRFG
ncbi:MAG: FAD-dependent oxidoreductase [Hyphomicrobiales bacterium]|nr:FAD-dependent oxidoreductase [Hyphomicrobiales bacterium]